LPVLDALVDLVDNPNMEAVRPQEVSKATGLSEGDVLLALQALEADDLIEVRWLAKNAGIARVAGVSGNARRIVGAWPSPEQYADRLLEALEEQARSASDETERTRVRRVLDAIRDVGRDVLVQAAATALAGRVPR
jgi:hypothetical protein